VVTRPVTAGKYLSPTLQLYFAVNTTAKNPTLSTHPLQVPVAGGPPHFRLHIQPGSPAQPVNNHGQLISRAGEGKGLQVFPGSVTEVTAPEVGSGHRPW
jgi:hypothetical protein